MSQIFYPKTCDIEIFVFVHFKMKLNFETKLRERKKSERPSIIVYKIVILSWLEWFMAFQCFFFHLSITIFFLRRYSSIWNWVLSHFTRKIPFVYLLCMWQCRWEKKNPQLINFVQERRMFDNNQTKLMNTKDVHSVHA
jgi:predicted membrane protein